MKIAFLTPFYPYRGGVPQFGHLLYRELSRNNEVEVFSYTTLYPQFLFPGKSQFVEPGDIRTDLPSRRTLSTVNPVSFAATAGEVNKFAPDILLLVYWIPYQAVALGSVAHLVNKRTKVVGFVHNALPHESSIFERVLGRYFFKACDAFVCMSDLVKNDLVKLIGQKRSIIVLDHPIYEHYGGLYSREVVMQELRLDISKKTLLFFGLIREYKGLDLLIEAMSLLDSGYQLLIVGESYENFSKYSTLIDQSSASDRIIVLQHYIPDEEVARYFAVADVLVLPYRSATQSGVVATAIQMQTPMIATNVGAIGDTVRKAKTGLVVDEVSPQAIANGVSLFFSSPIDYTEALQKEKERLSFRSFTLGIEAFFESLKPVK